MTTFFKSEDGLYFARDCGGGNFEAWTADGSIHWRNDDRPQTWESVRAGVHPLQWMVGGYSATMYREKPGTFTLTLLNCNPRKKVKPYTGNTVIERRYIKFRRGVPPSHMPQWFKDQARSALASLEKTA